MDLSGRNGSGGRADRLVSNPARIAAFGGGCHALVVHWVYSAVRHDPIPRPVLPAGLDALVMVIYAGLGLVLLGAVPLFLLLRDRLALPLATHVALYAWVTYRSWLSLAEARAIAGGPGINPRADAVYVGFWSAPLLVVLLAAVLELALRRAVTWVRLRTPLE
ncbi:hypothetical protein [Halovivax sp.]|uniref:hypothetical protein n=1 Tax=Halovivax sp. TaxID=1935978 RepID=UPI0025C0AF9A|nr:hypothetical protein [Halovivax sp.]